MKTIVFCLVLIGCGASLKPAASLHNSHAERQLSSVTEKINRASDKNERSVIVFEHLDAEVQQRLSDEGYLMQEHTYPVDGYQATSTTILW